MDEAVLREWVVNAGRRPAYEGMAHLMCEMHLRMKQVGLVSDHEIALPLTHEELGDALGLTAIHTNRVLKQLREEGLITFKGKVLTIHDLDGLRKAGGFDPEYLHVSPEASGRT